MTRCGVDRTCAYSTARSSDIRPSQGWSIDVRAASAAGEDDALGCRRALGEARRVADVLLQQHACRRA